MDSSSPDALAAVRASLEALADALAAARIEPVLALDASIARAVARLRSVQVSAANAGAVRRDLRACRTALDRCVRLGATVDAFLHDGLAVQGCDPQYRPAMSPVTGRALQARA